jgi:hypothetical protein
MTDREKTLAQFARTAIPAPKPKDDEVAEAARLARASTERKWGLRHLLDTLKRVGR